MTLAPATARRLLFGVCVLVSSAGWWAGIVPGVIWSVLVSSGLVIARLTAARRGTSRPLASMPLWQVVLVPVLSVPVGIALGALVFSLGPGF